MVLPFKVSPSSIATGLYCKVNPDDAFLLFYQQLIIVLMVQVADVQKNSSIAQRLFDAYAAYIHRTSRQVVTRCNTPYRLVHRWTSEPRVDDYRVITLTVQIIPTSP
jgi:hypothetical protein